MPAEDAVNNEPKFVTFKIDSIIPHAETMEGPARPLKFAKRVQFRVQHLLRQSPELTQNVQLQLLGHAGQLSGAGGIEDNLERAHKLRLVARTGIAPVFQP